MAKTRKKQPKKKKNRLKNFIFNFFLVIFLLLGLALIFNGQIKNFFIKNMVDKTSIADISADDINKNKNKKATFDFDAVSSIDLESVLKARLDGGDYYQLGGIAIPSVKINLPIYKGVSNYAMSFGAGTMKESQEMGAGNYALASHDMIDKSLLFSPLHNIEIGAKIYLTDLSYVYTYNVTVKTVVAPSKIEVIDDVPDKTLITLVTCNNNGADRLIVQGEFKEKVPVKEATKEMTEAFNAELNPWKNK